MSRQSIGLLDLSLVASGAVSEARAVGFGGAQVASQGVKVLGVANQAAASGAGFTVRARGTAVIETGAAITLGASLIADAEGRAIPATGTLGLAAGAVAVTSSAANGAILTGGNLPEFVFADALQAASGAGEFIEVLMRG